MSKEIVKPTSPHFQDLTNKRFGRLVVVAYAGTRNGSLWLCRCDCGKNKAVRGTNLRSGSASSCGCYAREVQNKNMRLAIEAATTHGKTKTLEYNTWRGMIARCYNKKCDNYPRYGGRGITVCNRWRFSFESFLADMGQRPSRRHSIDRIDGTKGYYKENCRWATIFQQARNNRHNRMIAWAGMTKTISEWAEHTGIDAGCIQARLSKLGWSVERTLTTPKMPKWDHVRLAKSLSQSTTTPTTVPSP